MIDNFSIAKDLIAKQEGYVYLVYVQRRHKDGNPDVGEFEAILSNGGANTKILIGYWLFASYEELMSKSDEIKQLCADRNARAYLVTSPKPLAKINRMILEKKASSWISTFRAIYDTKDADKMTLLIDADTKDAALVGLIVNDVFALTKMPPIILPTPNGFGIATAVFPKGALGKYFPYAIIPYGAALLYYAKP